LRKIVKPPQKRQKDLVNLFNFSGVNTFSPLLSGMDLKVNYLIGLASVSQLETISEAICSTSICETLSMYVAAVLEEQYGVIEVKTAAPYGIDWTNAWLREIGKITGHEEQAEKVIAEEWMKYKDEIEDLRDKLSGKKLYVFAGDSFASNLANAGKSLGLEIAGVTSLHHDVKMDNPESVNSMDALVRTNGDIPNFSICNVQPYQVIKLIQKQNPDLLLCRHPHISSVGTKLGIPSVFEGDANQSGAYYGVVKLGRRLYEALQTGGFEKNIIKHIKLPYTDWWIKQENPFYFEGGEKNEFGN
jgi:nitrogenase molybdenum-iron protein alpha chain